MANFNLENYEEVKDRIPKFYNKYPDGRIITELVNFKDGKYIVKCFLYKDETDVVISTGYAEEKEGQGYVNKTSALENCETSSIGRALANIGLHGDKRPSREEMQKVVNNKDQKKVYDDLYSKLDISENQIELEKVGQEIKTKTKSLTEKQTLELKKLYSYKLKYFQEVA